MDRCPRRKRRNVAAFIAQQRRATYRCGHPQHVVRELFVAVWKHQHWPAQDMSFERWDSLATLAKRKESANGNFIAKEMAISFPGGVMAKRAGEILRLDAELPALK